MTTTTAERPETRTQRARRVRDDRVAPEAVPAERALLAALLVWPGQFQDVSGILVPDDFVAPAHRAIWSGFRALAAEGAPIDAALLANWLAREGLLDMVGGEHYLVGLLGDQWASGKAVLAYANDVLGAAQSRRMIQLGARISDLGYDTTIPVDERFDQIQAMIVESAHAFAGQHRITRTPTISDIVAVPWEPTDWVVEGVLARGHRLVVVARAGRGKSTLLRQVMLFLAAGFHPLIGTPDNLSPHRVMRTFVLDLENDERSWRHTCRAMEHWLVNHPQAQRDRLDVLIHAPVGKKYDPIRKRADRMDLFARLHDAHVNGGVDIFSLTPIYKMDQMANSAGGSDWMGAAAGVQDLLDEIRSTFDCSILIEAHAGRSGPSVKGASEWENWPELLKSLRMKRDDPFVRTLVDVRPARYQDMYQWFPWRITKGPAHMPLIADWPDGTFIPDGGPPAYMRAPDWHLATLLDQPGRANEAPVYAVEPF